MAHYPKLVVFDWNGTILADTIASWKASNDCLEYYGAKPISMARFRETVDFPVLHFYKRNGCSVERVLGDKGGANHHFQTQYRMYSKSARTRKGTRDLLEWLRGKGIDRTILSNYLTPRIVEDLRRLKLDPYFSHVCGNTDDGSKVLEHATKQKRLADFLADRGYHAKDVVIVGDSTEEPEIAHRMGLKSISITGGYFSTSRLHATNPTAIVNRLDQIIDLLDSGL
jgi:phosphoglycolate phosphatase